MTVGLIVLIIVCGTLGVLFLLRPSLEEFRVARADGVSAEHEYGDTMAHLEELKTLQTELTRVDASQMDKLQQLFLTPPEIAYLTTLLSNHAQAATFLLTSLELTASPSALVKGPLEEVGIQLQLRGGGYRELKEFFKLVSISVPLLDMSSFTFDPASANVSLNLKAWRVKTPGVSSASDLEFLNDPRFRALRAPVALPSTAPVGRENPFAPVLPENSQNSQTPSNSPSERGRK